MKSLFITDITIVHLPLQEKKSITMNPFFGAALGNRNVCFTLTEKPKLRGLVGWWFFFSPFPFMVDANLQKSWFNTEVLLLNFDLTPTF